MALVQAPVQEINKETDRQTVPVPNNTKPSMVIYAVMPALERPKQEDQELKSSLSYIVRPSL